MDAKTNHRIVR